VRQKLVCISSSPRRCCSGRNDADNFTDEVTIDDNVRVFWQSAFYAHERINTSTPFATALGFKDQLLPFPLLLFLAGSMSHADAAKMQIAYSNAYYCYPAYAGDTFRKEFVVKKVRTTSDKEQSIMTFGCRLLNQQDRVIFHCDKVMLFPFPRDDEAAGEYMPVQPVDGLMGAFATRSSVLGELGNQSVTPLRPGQLILHSLQRPLTDTQSRQLSTLARLTHERHFDSLQYPQQSDRYIPGGLIVGMLMSASSRDFHEVLHEAIPNCSFIRKVHPGDSVGAISFITDLQEDVGGDLESITVRTIGVKNFAVRDLRGRQIPTKLFTEPRLQQSSIDAILEGTDLGDLGDRIVVAADRKILRQSPRHEVFLL